jgi:hypothetical protein
MTKLFYYHYFQLNTLYEIKYSFFELLKEILDPAQL